MRRLPIPPTSDWTALHRWPLQEASGSTAVDDIASDNLTINGGVTLQSTAVGTAVPSVSMLTNGTTGYLVSAANAPANMMNFGFVLSLWYQPTVTATTNYVMAVGDANGSVNGGVGLVHNAAGTLSLVKFGVGTLATTTATLTTGDWYRIAMYLPPVGSSLPAGIFISGAGSAKANTTLTAFTSNRVSIGCYWTSASGGSAGGINIASRYARVAAFAADSFNRATLIAAADWTGQSGLIRP